MTGPQKTKKELLIEKKANDDLLDVSSNNVADNRLNVQKAYAEIITQQSLSSSNLPTEKRIEMNSILLETSKRIDYLNTEINKLDVDDAKSEITETLLKRSINDALIEATKKREDVLGPIELGQNYKQLVEKMHDLDETGKSLVDNHLELVNKNIEINKSIDNIGSLVKDYADTSVNMPSYMDPDD